MLGLAWATLPDQPEYRIGVILVGVARCIAVSIANLYGIELQPSSRGLYACIPRWYVKFPIKISLVVHCLRPAHLRLQVMIWNQLAGGEHNYCAIIVIINSILQIVLYAPMAVFFVNVISRETAFSLEYSTVAVDVLIVGKRCD